MSASNTDDLPVDPTHAIAMLLVHNWDTSRTALAEPPEFHTGRWSWDDKMPCVAIHGKSEDPLSGGETGYTATHGPTGKGMQEISGYCLVDCVAGTRDETQSVGVNGDSVNPKKVRFHLETEAKRILMDYSPADLNTVAPGPGNDMTDSADEEDIGVSYRHQLRAKFTTRQVPTQ